MYCTTIWIEHQHLYSVDFRAASPSRAARAASLVAQQLSAIGHCEPRRIDKHCRPPGRLSLKDHPVDPKPAQKPGGPLEISGMPLKFLGPFFFCHLQRKYGSFWSISMDPLEGTSETRKPLGLPADPEEPLIWIIISGKKHDPTKQKMCITLW